MLLFNRTISAQEALDWGLISRLIPASEFEVQTEKLLSQWSKLPKEALRVNKKMVRGLEKEKLHEVNRNELISLKERFKSPESIEATKKFLESRRKK